jgi:hypothetical protein
LKTKNPTKSKASEHVLSTNVRNNACNSTFAAAAKLLLRPRRGEKNHISRCLLFFVSLFFQHVEKGLAMKRFAVLFTVVCSAALWSGAAKASLISVNFNSNGSGLTYSGAAAAGQVGDVWNLESTSTGSLTTATALKDSTGAATSAMLTFSAKGVGYPNNQSQTFYGSDFAGLMDSYLYGSSSLTVSFSLTGLVAGTYDLYLYSASNSKTRAATFTATTSVNASGVSTTIGPNGDGIQTFKEGVTYGIVEVTVGADGVLNVTSSCVSSSEIDLCGFQLQSVPEPTAMALMISVAIGLLAYAAWKRKK